MVKKKKIYFALVLSVSENKNLHLCLRRYVFLNITHITLHAHDAAHDDDVPRSASLHVRHDLFNHANCAEKVGFENHLHLVQADALHGAEQPHACVVYCRESWRGWTAL